MQELITDVRLYRDTNQGRAGKYSMRLGTKEVIGSFDNCSNSLVEFLAFHIFINLKKK